MSNVRTQLTALALGLCATTAAHAAQTIPVANIAQFAVKKGTPPKIILYKNKDVTKTTSVTTRTPVYGPVYDKHGNVIGTKIVSYTSKTVKSTVITPNSQLLTTDEVMARNPATTRLQLSLQAGAAFLSAGQRWGAVVDPPPNGADRDKLVGGIFRVGAFAATIVGFTTTPRGQVVCEFDADPHCAGEQLYQTANGTATADLSEAEEAARLWSPIGVIMLDNKGNPTTNSVTSPISAFAHPTTSTTFWFSTRMAVTIAGRTYRGPLSTPVSAPYMHPAPLPPDFCLDVAQLGTDYYGRALVKVSTIDCKRFDPDLLVSLTGSEGHFPPPEEMSPMKGIFSPQAPFQDVTVFEGFEALARTPEGEPFTLGTAYVRGSDGAASSAHVQEIMARTKGD